jgi:hypothetical protein
MIIKQQKIVLKLIQYNRQYYIKKTKERDIYMKHREAVLAHLLKARSAWTPDDK